LHLSAVDGVLGRYDFVCDLLGLEDNEAEAPRPASVAVIAHKRLVHCTIVFKILSEFLVRCLPAQATDEYFATTRHFACI
jgi:hypothetical protein